MPWLCDSFSGERNTTWSLRTASIHTLSSFLVTDCRWPILATMGDKKRLVIVFAFFSWHSYPVTIERFRVALTANTSFSTWSSSPFGLWFTVIVTTRKSVDSRQFYPWELYRPVISCSFPNLKVTFVVNVTLNLSNTWFHSSMKCSAIHAFVSLIPKILGRDAPHLYPVSRGCRLPPLRTVMMLPLNTKLI